ncbi:MAG: hypothetical protein AAFN79_00005 [Pseudomonadota bacterium]
MSEEVSDTYSRNVERPTGIVRMVLRMILGAGLIVALILKVYMMVLTDYACVEGETSLGAMIRCAGVLDMLGFTLAVAAGIEVAASLFLRSQEGVQTAIVLALASTVLLALSRDLADVAGWRSALVIGTLVICLLLVRTLWDYRQR